MFSIIIPLYNKEAYVVKTLQSVLQQTYKDFEVILVDDGSTDNSVAVIQPYLEDPRFRLISQANQGVSAARNKGIDHAQFALIAFLDADDLWHPQYLEEHRRAWESLEDVAIIGSRYQMVEQGDEVVYESLGNAGAYLLPDYFGSAYKSHWFWTCSLTVRKEVFKTIRFNPALSAAEDLDVWFRTLFAFGAGYIPQVLSYYVNSVNTYAERFNLPPLQRHLAGILPEAYEPLLQKGKEAFNAYIYTFMMKFLLMYYFNPDYRQEARRIYRKIPAAYRLRSYVSLMYTLPYPVAKRIFFWKINK